MIAVNDTEKCQRCSGYTLLELAISVPLLAVFGVALLTLVTGASQAVGEQRTLNEITERNRVALQRMISGLRPAMSGSVILLHEDRIRFTVPAGYDGTSVLSGDTWEYEFRLQGGVGQLVVTNVTTNTVSVVCENADVAGSAFGSGGDTVTITMVNTDTLPDGQPHTVSRTVDIKLRN